MNDKKSFDFNSFVSANAGRVVSGYDYLRAVYKAHGLAVDFIYYFAKLFWPDFKIKDGLIFVAELFDAGRYRDLLNEGRNSAETQFWMNLLEITGLFDELSTDEAMPIAEALAASWNSKLNSELGSVSVHAKAIRDDETGEVFVTIGSANQIKKR